MALGHEEAAAIVLPNAFQDQWFHCQASTLAQMETQERMYTALKEIVPMVAEMDDEQRDNMVMALGRGLP